MIFVRLAQQNPFARLEGTPYPSEAKALHHRLAWVYAQRIRPVAKSVLVVLAYHHMPAGEGIFPSLETVASMTGFSKRTVQDALNRLEADGWIKRTQRRLRGKQSSNLYVIRQANYRGQELPSDRGRELPSDRGQELLPNR